MAKSKNSAGNGIGAHQEVSPMGHATRTKNRREKNRQRDRWDRKAKHKGKDW